MIKFESNPIWEIYDNYQKPIKMKVQYLEQWNTNISKSHFIWYLHFYYYHWVDTSVNGLLVPEGCFHLVVIVSSQTWFIT